MNTKHNFSKAFSVIVILAMLFSNTQLPLVQAKTRSGDSIKRELNAESSKVSFIGPERGQLLSAAQALDSFARPQDPAMALAERFAPEFGVQNRERDLSKTL